MLDNVGRILPGIWFSLLSFLPLCKGVITASFKQLGKLQVLIASFKDSSKKDAKISGFS